MDYVIDHMKRDDWEQVSLIFREGIATGYTAFETDAPSWEKWDVGHLEIGRLVARRGDKVLGWVALSPVSKRDANRGVAELSVLPREEQGYLRAVYEAAKKLKVGVGGPDLLPYKESQMGASYPMIRAASSHVPVGVAVQDGDYQQVNPRTSKEVTVSEIVQFGKEYLKVDYIFWCTEEPFYSERLIPFIKAQQKDGKR